MPQAMNVYEIDPSTGMRGLLIRGGEDGRGAIAVAVDHREMEIVLDPQWLADLHDPHLIISRGYVGPDRRRSDRSWVDLPARRSRTVSLALRCAQVVALALVAVVPLLLINAKAVPPATSNLAPVAAAPGAGGAASGSTHLGRAVSLDPVRGRVDSRAAVGAPAVRSRTVGNDTSARAERIAGRTAARNARADARAEAQNAAALRRSERAAARDARSAGGGPVAGVRSGGSTRSTSHRVSGALAGSKRSAHLGE